MSAPPDVNAINAALGRTPDLLGFDLKREAGRYTLTLTLGRGEQPAVLLICTDVQNLELNPTGDGFEKLLKLQVNDVSDDGLDRIRFSVEEVERETLFLHCFEIAMKTLRPALT